MVSWYGLKKSEIKELEALDKMLLKNVLKAPFSTPTEALQLELGILSITTIIKARRINYLHYLAARKESEMLAKFFQVQWEYGDKNYWTNQFKLDLDDLGISSDLNFIRSISKPVFKSLVKRKATEFELKRLLQIKSTHSKMSGLEYSKL